MYIQLCSQDSLMLVSIEISQAIVEISKTRNKYMKIKEFSTLNFVKEERKIAANTRLDGRIARGGVFSFSFHFL